MKILLGLIFAALSTLPVAAQQAIPIDGAAVFASKGCVYCHGAEAQGITGKAPSLQNVGATKTQDGIRTQIHDGGLSMPAFGEALNDDELTALVQFLSAKKLPLQKPAAKSNRKQ